MLGTYKQLSVRIAALAFVCGMGHSSALAQQAGAQRMLLPDAPIPQRGPGQVPQESRKGTFKTSLQVLGHRSLFFPELAFEKGSLSSLKKLELAVDESIAPSRLTESAFVAAIGQAQNSPPDYHQGAAGYGKRYGASLATNASSQIFGTFVLASALRQDPRYFVMLRGSPSNRVLYALRRVAVTRTDQGREAANWSGILGPLIAESLANSYLPDSERTAGKTFGRFGIRIGFSAASNVVKEYWPTIFKSLRIGKFVPAQQSDPGTVTPTASRQKP
jgi:hypothetical protein